MSDHSEQKSQSESALKKKKASKNRSDPNHGTTDRTSDQGMHPVEREKPITPEEKARD